MLIKMFQTVPLFFSYDNYMLPSHLLHDIICLMIRVIYDEGYSGENILINTTKATLEQVFVSIKRIDTQIILSLCQRVSEDSVAESKEEAEEEDMNYNKSLLMLLKVYFFYS